MPRSHIGTPDLPAAAVLPIHLPTAPSAAAPGTLADPPGERLASWLVHTGCARPFLRAQAARRLTVLAYGRVTDQRAFGAQLDRLCRVAVPVSLPALEQALAQEQPLPPRSVLITFDDADRTVLEHALPALTARGLPAVAFVATELVGSSRPSWREEAAFLLAHGGSARALRAGGPAARLAQLVALPDPDRRRSLHELRVSARAGAPGRVRLTPAELRHLVAARVAVGSQCTGDPELPRCDEATVRAEVQGAHQALTGWLGAAPTAFAYPGGSPDPRTAALLVDLGYRTAFLTDHRLSPRLPRSALQISRLPADATADPDRFEATLAGLPRRR
ncbi:polysaccharide deacetylase family protein [Kitasatospora sp. NPDC058965]|uniref:polysaccharide deacetylase family protein n=1 Tax=Kitasatospora sp. NPDC058965 TaxID=3346682 RepID=UPI0036B40572